MNEMLAANAVYDGLRIIRFDKLAQRLAKRFGKQVADAYLKAVAKFTKGINLTRLRGAIAGGKLSSIQAAVASSGFARMLQALEDPLAAAAVGGGHGSAQVLHKAGFELDFQAHHPNVILFARDRSAAMVQGIGEDVREAIRTVVALGAAKGLTVAQQARAIKEVVGVPPHMVNAPFKFEDELRAGDVAAATSRRLSASQKQRIRGELADGEASETFIADMREEYSASLISYRADMIARTESLKAVHFGLQESWEQAVQDKILPHNMRRFWLITPRSRTCDICRQIPEMNEEGRGMNTPFQTPLGPVNFPPVHPNCACGIGLGMGEAAYE